MKTQPRRLSLLRAESGQAAALVALLLFFVFLPFAALAIDGAMIYLVRRDLQNVADASALSACRVLAGGGASSAATDAARNTIRINLGSWEQYVTPEQGSGASLLRGIEISEVQVRVAMQRQVPTVLTQFVGRGETIATAQARCDSTAGGGLLPIAVQRYEGQPGGTLRDHPGNKAASGYPPSPPPVPYPDDSSLVTWNGRYGPFQVPVPKSEYTASDGAVDDPNTGPEMLLLGQSAETNNNESGMRDLVLLDIRNVASVNSLEYYNGANSQANAAKDMSQDWIYRHGYPGPYPQIGSQVAILDGASNNFTARAMQTAGYRPGDAVAAIVYDGFVWTAPDFVVDLIPTNPSNGIASGYPTSDSEAVEYSVSIDKAGAANEHWFSPLSFNLTFDFTNDPLPPGTHVTLNGGELDAPGYAYSVNNVTEAGGWNGTLRIWSTEAVTQVRYLSGLNLIADSNLGLTRAASSNFGFGDITADHAARSNSGRLVIRQGSSATANLVAFGAGTSLPSQCKNVPVRVDILAAGAPLSWGLYFSSGQTDDIIVKKSDQFANLALNARDDAFTGSYVLRLSVGSAAYRCNSLSLPVHTVEIPIQILPPVPNATPNKFVLIQGYTIFRISRMDANDVWGYAISPLYPYYEDIHIGLRPRLVPWD